MNIAEAVNEKGKSVLWRADYTTCPHCKQAIIWLASSAVNVYPNNVRTPGELLSTLMCWPQGAERPVALEVPVDIRRDFTEAVRVLPISAQASAALTRRTLQQILREYAKTSKKDLFEQIQEVIDAGHLPSSLSEQLHSVRVIGNFAAHPLKSQSTGLILPVEPEEAEWNLEVLEDVFDHYFVKPAQTKLRMDNLNKKLTDAGKSPI